MKTDYPSFAVIDVKTIKGQEEALFDWLTVNYLNGSLTSNSNTVNPTQAVIDIGGASAELAFENENNSSSDYNITKLNIFGKSYKLYTNSILHAGQDEARNKMDLDFNQDTNYCYIEGSSSTIKKTSFNEDNCNNEFKNLINNSNFMQSENPQDIRKIPTIPTNMKIVATASAYYAYSFFVPSVKESSVGDLDADVKHYCTLSWSVFLGQLDISSPNAYTSQYCANAVYIHNLLTSFAYNLSDNALLTITNSLPSKLSPSKNVDIDWTLGALLYNSSAD